MITLSMSILHFYPVDNVSNCFRAEADLNGYPPVYLCTCDISRHASEFNHHLTVYLNHTVIPLNRALTPVVSVMPHGFLFIKNTNIIVAATAYNNMYHVHCGVTIIRFSTG